MADYAQLAAEVVELVGGKANVSSLTHCVTRLRFKLKDESAADDKAIGELKGVVSVIKSGGQYQVVIGPAVGDVYDEAVAILGTGLAGGEVPDDDDVPAKKVGAGARALDFLTSAIGPSLGMICAGGIIKGIVALLGMFGVIADGQLPYELLNAAGDAVYYFLPVVLGYTLALRLKVEPILGILMGAALVYPDIQKMEGASLFGIDYSGVGYTTTMFPIIFVMLAAAPLDRLLRRALPVSIKSFAAPALDLLIMVPLGYLVIGPVANALSSALGAAIGGLYGMSPALCGLVLCALWQVLVLFGIHMGLAAVIFAGMFAVGSSALYPMTCIPCFAQFGICVAIYLRSRNAKLRELALPSAISAAFGTTEPAIYGLTLPNIKYFILSCVTSGIAGIWMGLSGVTAYQLGGNGFLSFTIVMNEADTSSLMNFAISIAFVLILSFVLTMVMWKDPEPAGSEAAAA